MMSSGYPWMFYIPSALMIVFCFGAICYVVSRSSEYGRARAYAMAALAMILIAQLFVPLGSAVLSRLVNASEIALTNVILETLSTTMMMFSLGLLIVAAFIDRQPASASSLSESGGTPLADHPNDNPYASPRQ
jgi:chromate transport protein ChrA